MSDLLGQAVLMTGYLAKQELAKQEGLGGKLYWDEWKKALGRYEEVLSEKAPTKGYSSEDLRKHSDNLEDALNRLIAEGYPKDVIKRKQDFIDYVSELASDKSMKETGQYHQLKNALHAFKQGELSETSAMLVLINVRGF